MSPEQRAALIIKEMGFVAPPIDVEAICKYLGIKLVFLDRRVGKVLGVSTSFPTPGGAINVCSVNSRPSLGRKRFTIAHEIGHFALGHFGDDTRTTTQERDANRFASELLMPDDILAFEWCWYDVETLARRYAVSVQAMTIRIKAYQLELVI